MADKKDEDFLKKFYQDFMKAKDSTRRKEFEEDREAAKRAFKGQVFTDSQEKAMENSGIPPVKVTKGTTNALRLASIMSANRPEIKAVPMGGGDGYIADLIGRAYKKIWEQSTGNRINFNAILGAIKEGIDHFNVTSEKYGMAGDVRIKISKIGAKKIYYGVDTPEDAVTEWTVRYFAKPISKEEAKDLYNLKDDELYYEGAERPEDEDKDDGPTHDSAPGGRYDDSPSGSDTTEKKKEIWEIERCQLKKYGKKLWFDTVTQKAFPRSDTPSKDNQAKILWITQYPAEGGPERFEPIDVKEYDLLYSLVVGGKVIERDAVSPYGFDNIREPVDMIIPLINIPIGEVYPRGNMFFAIGPLQEVAKRRGQSIAMVAYQMGSPIVTKKGTVNLDEWRANITKPREVIEADWGDDPADKPYALYTALPDQSRVFALEDRANADVDDVFNLTPVLKGEAETGRMSGRLAAMLKEFGMEGNSYLLTAAEWAYRKLGVCLVVIALREWPFRYWERLLEDEDYVKDDKGEKTDQLEPGYIKALELIRNKDVSIIDYDIGIRPGSSLPANRMARLDMALELAREPVPPDAIYDAEAVLNYLDDPQAKQVLKRKNRLKQIGQQLEKTQNDMQQLIGEFEKVSKESQVMKDQIDKMKIQHVEDMGQSKFRYETTIQKTNDAHKAEIQKLIDTYKDEISRLKQEQAVEMAILKMQMENAKKEKSQSKEATT